VPILTSHRSTRAVSQAYVPVTGSWLWKNKNIIQSRIRVLSAQPRCVRVPIFISRFSCSVLPSVSGLSSPRVDINFITSQPTLLGRNGHLLNRRPYLLSIIITCALPRTVPFTSNNIARRRTGHHGSVSDTVSHGCDDNSPFGHRPPSVVGPLIRETGSLILTSGSLCSQARPASLARPPFDLPVELLQVIFTCCTEIMDKKYASPPWIAITRVCRHWRAVALDHHPLWTSITSQLTLGWAKAFMERSDPLPVNVSLFTSAKSWRDISPSLRELISLLGNCTRLRSLFIFAQSSFILRFLIMLPPQTSIHTFSLHCISHPSGHSTALELPVDLFRGRAPIRELSFNSYTYIVAPHWLLHGVTHFSCWQLIPPHALLDALREMPVLQYFELQYCDMPWSDTDAPPSPPIQMTSLMCFLMHAYSLRFFTFLLQRLALPEGAKIRLELAKQIASDVDNWAAYVPLFLTRFPAAARISHIHLYGGNLDGCIRIWAGIPFVTGYENAEFSFSLKWGRIFDLGERHSPFIDLASLCDLLGSVTARTLIFDRLAPGYYHPRPFLWAFLGKLTAVEELELRCNSAVRLRDAWRHHNAPAVMPALRSVRVVDPDPRPPGVAEITEVGLLRLLQGGGRQYVSSSTA